jgi:hypothetical protein
MHSAGGVGLKTPSAEHLDYGQFHQRLEKRSAIPTRDECPLKPSEGVHLAREPVGCPQRCSFGATPPLRRPTASNAEVVRAY